MAEAASTQVKILESTRIKPPPDPPNSATEVSLQLTFADTFWFKIAPVERLFFYQLDNSTSTPAYFNSEILPKLKHSLSLSLLHHLPLAGNLKWPSDSPKPFILYTPNDGVSLTVAETNADFDRLSSNGIDEALELHPLMPQLISSYDSASILALQITLFPNKGFCIGITAHHTALDGKTTTMFMKSWAYLCNQENSALPIELTPFFDRNIIKDPTGFDLDMLYLNQWLTNDGSASEPEITKNKTLKISTDEGEAPNLVRATFDIRPEDFKKLRERVLLSKSSEEEQLHLSKFVLTLAYVATCMIKARVENNRDVLFGFTADCRSRLDPPVPQTYFGNCNTIFTKIVKAADFMDENGFALAVKQVSDMVKKLETRSGVFEGAKEKLTPIFHIGPIQLITVAGSPHFDVYGSDFGWGRPCKVEIVSIDKNGAISMAESRDGSRGIEVGLALKKHEMERFSSLFLKNI
ncbi:Transferase [Corchorus olitorius]|uniref:Transferase n=1 Tax=Corchorus olitorius TaxID=93759 RepID=A0A1R3G9Y3_9ROSI|nr:Transferase [Corchorus olitorius]